MGNSGKNSENYLMNSENYPENSDSDYSEEHYFHLDLHYKVAEDSEPELAVAVDSDNPE